MTKSKLFALTVITVLLLSFTIAIVAAQYQTEKTTDVIIANDGTFNTSEADVGVAYQIQGTAGATGSVTADVYNGNPQPTAVVPTGITLAHFVAITFNMNANDFQSATIVISYSDNDVQGISGLYTVYKYDANSDSYVPLASTVDTAAKTITVTVTSISDPLFAIGGTTATSSGGGFVASTWAILIASVIAIVLLSVFVVSLVRKGSDKQSDSKHWFKL